MYTGRCTTVRARAVQCSLYIVSSSLKQRKQFCLNNDWQHKTGLAYFILIKSVPEQQSKIYCVEFSFLNLVDHFRMKRFTTIYI